MNPIAKYLKLVHVADGGGYPHIWKVDLNQAEFDVTRLETLLSFDERQRAERFYFDKDRHRFIVCHGLLKILLARYAKLEPANIQFIYGKNGKPALAKRLNPKDIRFSLSCSIGVGLIGINRGREIGVDIEHNERIIDCEQLVDNFFSEKEKRFFRSQSEKLKSEMFFKLWTKKEALVKAIGAGLSIPLDSFDVSSSDCEIVKFPAMAGLIKKQSLWQLNVMDSIGKFTASWAVQM